MAKIILVSKQVTETSWQLAQALKSQQHEVVLLTSYGESPRDDSPGIDLMAYFRRWNVAEGLKIIPGLFGLHPQILHILLDEDKLNSAQLVLATFAKSHPSCVLTTSLLNIRRGLHRRNLVRYLIEESDIITCPTVETLGQLRGLNIKSKRQGRGILPPVLNLKNVPNKEHDFDQEQSQQLEMLTRGEFIVIPFREPQFQPKDKAFERICQIAQKYKVVLLGSYSQWSVRDRKRFAAWMEHHHCQNNWVITGDISPETVQILFQKSTAVFLAGQDFSPIEMTEYYNRAIQSHAGLILDSQQSSLHADLWKNTENCWILNGNSLENDLEKLLAKSSLKLPESLSERLAQDRHLIDSSLNELNRLYNRALLPLR